MARTFVITDTAADSGFNVGSSGETAGATLIDREILEGGSGSGTANADIGNSASDIERAVIALQSDTGAPEPNDTSWEAGDYVVNINVTTARPGMEWRASYLMARTSGGSYTTVASLTGQTDSLAAPGVVTHTINLASDFTANASDTMYFLLVLGGAINHGNSFITVTMGENIVTPLDVGVGPISASPAIVIGAPTVDLKGQGKLDAIPGIIFSLPSADLKGEGKLDAAASIVLAAPSVDLKALGKLDAVPNIVFAVPSADLVDGAAGPGPISASPALVFSLASADLKAKGKLDGSLGIVFGATADLKARGVLDATPDIVFSLSSADLKGLGQLDASATIVFAVPNANLVDQGGGGVSASPAVIFGATADLNAGGALNAVPALVVSLAADLGGRGKLDAAASIVFAASADLKGRGVLGGIPALVFSLTPILTDKSAIQFYHIEVTAAIRRIAITAVAGRIN